MKVGRGSGRPRIPAFAGMTGAGDSQNDGYRRPADSRAGSPAPPRERKNQGTI